MSSPTPPSPASWEFLTTRWSLVLSAGRGESRAALESLCASYWYPLYAFVRRKGESHERAADMVQGFFLVVLERRDFAGLAPERGRFRSFLLAALSHHMSNERDRERALKRGGGVAKLPLEGAIPLAEADTRYAVELSDEESPEKLFERRWAIEVLSRTFERLEREHRSPEKIALFEALKPELQGSSESSYAELAARLGTTEGALRTAAHRLRNRWRELLRAEVAGTLSDPADVEDEIRGLFAALAG
jgi:RNA polymerase sigma factor (sigma-70 family)